MGNFHSSSRSHRPNIGYSNVLYASVMTMLEIAAILAVVIAFFAFITFFGDVLILLYDTCISGNRFHWTASFLMEHGIGIGIIIFPLTVLFGIFVRAIFLKHLRETDDNPGKECLDVQSQKSNVA